jgi:hypothetical protein
MHALDRMYGTRAPEWMRFAGVVEALLVRDGWRSTFSAKTQELVLVPSALMQGELGALRSGLLSVASSGEEVMTLNNWPIGQTAVLTRSEAEIAWRAQKRAVASVPTAADSDSVGPAAGMARRAAQTRVIHATV